MAKTNVIINPRLQSYYDLQQELAPTPEMAKLFANLNPHMYRAMVLPGELVIVPDPAFSSCTLYHAEVINSAFHVRNALRAEQAPLDDFLINNHGLISKLLFNASLAVGMGSDAWSRHLNAIADTLKDIDNLHATHTSSGSLADKPVFYEKRAGLFAKLDNQLNWLAQKATQLRKETSIKNMLGISMKSYLDKGEIRGYQQKIAGVTRAAKFAKAGGHIGILLSIESTRLEIRKACMTGREEACRKAKYVEGAKLVGSVGGSITGGLAGAALGNRVCAAISIASRGTLNIACIAIATGATGYGVSELGEKGMGAVGDLIYEKVYD